MSQEYEIKHIDQQKLRIALMFLGAKSVSPKTTFAWCKDCGSWLDSQNTHHCGARAYMKINIQKPWRTL
jgi:hypothetical protein